MPGNGMMMMNSVRPNVVPPQVMGEREIYFQLNLSTPTLTLCNLHFHLQVRTPALDHVETLPLEQALSIASTMREGSLAIAIVIARRPKQEGRLQQSTAVCLPSLASSSSLASLACAARQ